MSRTVPCRKLQREAPGLEAPPFSGALGEEIFNNISAEAWRAWQDDFMIKVINEYRLNLVEPSHYEVLVKQMKAFLNLGDAEAVLEVENAERGKGSA